MHACFAKYVRMRTIQMLYAYMKILTFLLLLVSLECFSCEQLIGTFKSFSETHWNFELQITQNKVLLKYTDYEYGVRDLRTDYVVESEGYCDQSDTGYVLIFGNKSVNVQFHKSLSHSSFGGSGDSPGITGEFIEGQQVELWQGI